MRCCPEDPRASCLRRGDVPADPAIVRAAAEADPFPLLAPAFAAHIVEFGADAIRFGHPLFAATVYGLVDSSPRRELHGRLAVVVDDVEERARHLALAAEAPRPRRGGRTRGGRRARGEAWGAQEAATELAELAVPRDAARPHRRPAAAAGDRGRASPPGRRSRRRRGTPRTRSFPEAAGVERARVLLPGERRRSTTPSQTLDFLEQALLARADDLLVAEIEMERAGVPALSGPTWAPHGGRRGRGARAARSAGDRLLVAFAVAQSSLFDVVGGELPDLAALAAAEEVEREAFVWPSAYPPSLVLGMCLMYADRLDEAREAPPKRPDLRMGERGKELVRGAALRSPGECECRAGRYERAAECAAESLQISERIAGESKRACT